MKLRSSIFLGLFLVLVAQTPVVGCAPPPDGPGGSGGAGTGGAAAGGAGAGGASAGGAGGGISSGGAAAGGSPGIGGTAPMLTCGTGSGGQGELPPATFETLLNTIYYVGCDSSDCHGGHNDLTLAGTPDEVYDHLLNTVSEECGGLNVLVPGDPDASALVRLIKGPCGTLGQMPDGCVCDTNLFYNGCLRADTVAAIEAWVAAGAPK